ncbi:type-4 uracil-DNA glycosylase [Acidianus brierleyi]|uniref:Type-4 uracil-DNA glycosylase n=1 Tax=Acidianus brierleyi TaxID=41673 RepID=A0A2U9IEZ8_9CREN|nr:type-4 uracil-DNA glycosylase [Acidianus brierleyi]AWR94617.1 uracil-DNA glycosylase [Acidianus brierleyi]
MDLDELNSTIRSCKLCKLSISRTNAVPGEGNPKASVLFVGEAPGATEDKMGRPFVGSAGKLLDELLKSIGLDREKVYITNLVKCRPPNNRDPESDEISSCSPYLETQISLINPKIIVTLGKYSTIYMLKKVNINVTSISKVRGKFYEWNNILIFPTYHPAAALYNPNLKEVLEKDFKVLGSKIGSKLFTLDNFMNENGPRNTK